MRMVVMRCHRIVSDYNSSHECCTAHVAPLWCCSTLYVAFALNINGNYVRPIYMCQHQHWMAQIKMQKYPARFACAVCLLSVSSRVTSWLVLCEWKVSWATHKTCNQSAKKKLQTHKVEPSRIRGVVVVVVAPCIKWDARRGDNDNTRMQQSNA